jgi:hypothetical protein
MDPHLDSGPRMHGDGEGTDSSDQGWDSTGGN